MDKKEARKILGVSKETSRNDIERKFSILLKKQRMVKEHPADEAEQASGEVRDDGDKQEEYSFEQVTQAYNILMGYEVPVKEEPSSKAAPLFKRAGIDEKKARNFFYYYKYHMLAVIVAVISIVLIIRGCVNRVDSDFTIAFIGEISYSETDKLRIAIKEKIPEITEPGFDGAFISENDRSEQQYAMVMKATVLFAAGEVDVFILDKASFEKYAKLGAFMSLDEIAPKLGVDMEKSKEYIVKVEDSNDISSEETANEPAEEHLYGIDITKSMALKDSGIFGIEMIAALHVSGKQQDKAVKLLQFLLRDR